jgi:hypothetical protein
MRKPIKNETKMREFCLKIRLSRPEKEELARRAGPMSLAAFLRSCALDRTPVLPPEINQKAISELNKIGVNLNQLTRRMNSESDQIRLNLIKHQVFQKTQELSGALEK